MNGEQRNVATLYLANGMSRKLVLKEGAGAGALQKLLAGTGWVETATGERVRKSAVVAFTVERRVVEPGKEKYL